MEVPHIGGTFKSPYIRVAAIALILLVSLYAIVAAGLYKPTRQSITPSYEALHFAFIGLQPANSQRVFVANANASSLCLGNFNQCPFVVNVGGNGVVTATNGGTYSWQYSQTQATTKFCVGSSCVSVAINPASQQQQKVQSISYRTLNSTKNGGYLVNGAIYLTPMQLTLSVPPQSSDINLQLKGDVLWFAVYGSAWNNAQENGPQNGASWSTPMLTEFLGAPTPPGQGGTTANNYGTNPGTNAGVEPIALYSIPQTTSSFGGVMVNPGQVYTVNQSLASTNLAAPDSRMLPYGFFPVVLTNFGAYGCGAFNAYECDNTLQLNFETYTLQLGTTTWGNPITQTQTTQQGNCASNCPNPGADLLKWVQANSLWLGLAGLVGSILATVIILAVFASPVLVAVVVYLLRRRRDKL